MKEEIEEGWVIVNEGFIYGFTFKRKRVDAIDIWVSLWDKPSTWSAHYKRGVRCVRATKTIQLSHE